MHTVGICICDSKPWMENTVFIPQLVEFIDEKPSVEWDMGGQLFIYGRKNLHISSPM